MKQSLNSPIPSRDDDADDELSLSSESSSSVFRPASFRSSDGRCLFGALVQRNGTWERPVTVRTGVADVADKGRIVSVEGSNS